MSAEKRVWAYTGVVTSAGYLIGRADEGIEGYMPVLKLGSFPSWDAAQDRADELNQARGLSKKEAFRIVISTMRSLA